jgi:hypothetical protein
MAPSRVALFALINWVSKADLRLMIAGDKNDDRLLFL